MHANTRHEAPGPCYLAISLHYEGSMANKVIANVNRKLTLSKETVRPLNSTLDSMDPTTTIGLSNQSKACNGGRETNLK
jgi:hypothetical protein